MRGFLQSTAICFSKVTAWHPRCRLRVSACAGGQMLEVGMPTGTKRGTLLILASTTLVALAAALAVSWAAGAFDGPVEIDHWFAMAIVLGLAWAVGAVLVSFLFLGARLERNASLYEATALRKARSRDHQSPGAPR